jgi:crotonobetainyl-CoA:carnitine CoA-transferase CaiB-like acyl-CoA transferase
MSLPEANEVNRPLSGVRILDLTNVLAGPFCCHQLAHLGADVIKVEVPGSGDLARQLGADSDLSKNLMGISFLAQNTGKRSVTINLKSAAGKKLFTDLVKTADVVVENFRPGVMDRLGVGFEKLKLENPTLIYCAISGFGQDGPLRDLPAYDQIIQGMSGVMSITGDAESAPLRVGYPVADTIGGMTAAFAISSALAKEKSSRGCFIDVSMLESVLATMGWVVSNFLVAGKVPTPMGNNNFTASPSGTFRTDDGLINIAANKQEQFEAVCQIIGRPDLIEDPLFYDRHVRLANRPALTAQIEEALAAKSAAEWERLLNTANVPAGSVLSVEEALAHPQIAGRGMIGTFKNPPGVGRDISYARPGIKIDGSSTTTDLPPPELGQHTDEVLQELGYSAQEIEELKKGNAI